MQTDTKQPLTQAEADALRRTRRQWYRVNVEVLRMHANVGMAVKDHHDDCACDVCQAFGLLGSAKDGVWQASKLLDAALANGPEPKEQGK